MRWITCIALMMVGSAGCGGAESGSQAAAKPTTAASAPQQPVAEVRVVSNTYHGTKVDDPYQWLETDSLETKAWAAAQNTYARAQLDAMPNLKAVAGELAKYFMDPSPSFGSPTRRGKQLFFLRSQPPKEQAVLVVFDDLDKLENPRVVLDPTALDDEGTLTIDFYAPSPDGSRVAVSMSKRGSERGDLTVYDTATGKRLPDAVAHVQNGSAGGAVTWDHQGTGFYYTRYPREGERPDKDRAFYQQLWYHQLGTSSDKDRYELGKELPRIAEIKMQVRAQSEELLVSVQNGDGGEMAHYLRSAAGSWKQLSSFRDGTKAIFFGAPGELYIMSRHQADRGKILRLTGGSLDLSKAVEIIAEDKASIDWSFWRGGGIQLTDQRLYVTYQMGGPTRLRVFDRAGKRLSDLVQPSVGTTTGCEPLAGDDLLCYQTTFTTPGGWFRIDDATGTTRKLDKISKQALADFSDTEVIREFATSKDGTQVPLSILIRKNTPRDGSRPCVVTGYGGYGLSRSPGYRPSSRVYLDRGVCLVLTNLRGGGEYGEAWHRDGMLTAKQNVFDDFAAVLDHLVARGYTSHDKIGIIGGSNGGLLMGAMMTQHPDKMRAVVSAVGIYDSLRTELEPNGEFNITEFGTVKNPEHFRALLAYSPYHNVPDATRFPAVLFTHGDNDPRVASWHSRKMTARLQAANSGDRQILLRTSAKSGHGAGSLSEALSQVAHMYAFLLHHLGAN